MMGAAVRKATISATDVTLSDSPLYHEMAHDVSKGKLKR
jgi:hypothetical protein